MTKYEYNRNGYEFREYMGGQNGLILLDAEASGMNKFSSFFMMKFLVDFPEAGIGDVCVDLGRGDIFVTQKLLDCPKVGAVSK